jgi:hypothetical protein
MKKLMLCFALLGMISCQTSTKQKFNSYGATIATMEAIPLAALEQELAARDSVWVTVKGTIEKTCAKKGCWMTVTDEQGKNMRVTFKDYGFFVPTEGAENKEVIFAGYAKRKVTEVAMLKHFAEDAGKPQEEIDAIVNPEEEIVFEADGVVIYEQESSR